MEIGNNLKKVGIKFISSVDIQPQQAQIEFEENGQMKITAVDTEQSPLEATNETRKNLESTIDY